MHYVRNSAGGVMTIKLANKPVKIKKEYPSKLLLCDPSHISGNKDLICKISKKAIYKYKMDGLMIETHVNPKISLSDKHQQINPRELKKILYKLFQLK